MYPVHSLFALSPVFFIQHLNCICMKWCYANKPKLELLVSKYIAVKLSIIEPSGCCEEKHTHTKIS